MKNRIFAIFLVLVLLVEIIPTKVFAAMENPEGAVVEAITDSAEDSSTEGEAALEEPAIVPSEESSAEAVTEDDGTNSTFSDGSEATATNGSNTANTESTVEQTDTSVEAGTEENGNQTEATDSTEGSTDNTEGSTDNTQESTDTTGGSTDTTGGSTDSTGGSTDTTGGSTDSTGGSTDTTGGSTDTTGGSTDTTGGSTDTTGGSTDTTGGSTDTTGGSTDTTGGSTDTTGGSTDTTGGSTDNTGESTTDPSEPTPTTSSTIKVEKEGNNNGTVKLIIGDVEFDNADLEGTIDVEEGKTITIVATPTPSTETDETRSYVSQILINDQAIGLENYIKYEEYRKENITLQGDTTVKVTFATDYKVEATAQAGTQITLTDGANSDNNTSTTADKPKAELMIPENGTVNISITTDDGYKVENITILAADGTNEVISNDAQTVPFTKDGISVTGPMTISTQLRQYFNVTINYKTIGGTANTGGTVSYGTDIGNAELKTDNSNKIESTGTVEIGANTPFVLFVDPDANYKISSIIRTDARGDETELKPEGSFLNNEAYIDDTLLSIDQNYTYTIQFAPNTYTVTAEASPNGQIEIGEPKRMELTVNHGSEVTVDLTPALDYVVDSITLSEGQVEEEDIRYGEGDKVSFKIKDIQKNVKITVQFKTRPSITYVESGVSFNVESGVRKSNGLYVFKEGTQVVFQAVDGTATDGTITFSNQGLKVKEVEKDEVGGKDTTEVLLSDTDTQIESILVFGTKPGDKIATWYKVDLPDEKIRIAFDTQVPTVTLALPPKESGQTVYTEDVEVTINASDVADNDGDYSGIERIVYKILKDGTEMENGEILADAFTSIISEANQETVEAKLSIPAATYQSGNIEVRVTVVDKAGKESEEKKESLQIHTRPLAVEISVEDRREDEAIENNYQSRTLTITTTDSSYTLDEKKLFESIKIEPASLQSELLDNLEWQEVMNEEGGIGGYKTTINFTKDATYTLTFGSYTNKANQTADITLPENVVLDEFIIDNKQPELEFTLPSFDHPNQDVYNDDVHIKVKMKDEGEPGIGGYTGIKKLVYEIITLNADGQETRKEEIVDAFINVSEDKETGTANAEYTIVVDAETNISESVRVIVTITDKAGNSSRQEITPLKINPTPLKVGIRVDGKQKNYVLKENENENAYYYQSRTVEITTNDTSYTFNEEAFLEAIQFEDESLKTAILGQNGEKIQWDKQDGAYKATLIFPEKMPVINGLLVTIQIRQPEQ
ncbi:MAG: hypothetical protein IKM28_09625 [Lachnospiraceae bacterium]|nr:hypothetical protein [Lachnospiraceae bacterium]